MKKGNGCSLKNIADGEERRHQMFCDAYDQCCNIKMNSGDAVVDRDDKAHEECGIFGVWNRQEEDAAKSVYYGLIALQHRGQEAAGIAVCSAFGPRGNLQLHKDMGLVTEVFSQDILQQMQGNIGIGHVRYSTTGGSCVQNAQPIASYYLKGTLATVHNGNIVNSDAVRQMLMKEGYLFKATTDSEVIHVLLSRMRAKSRSIEEAVKASMPMLQGGYALLIMSPRKLIAARDPLGLKPMCLGKTENGYVIASESCALDAVSAEFIRDIEPGEILTISKHGLESDRTMCRKERAHCVFEYIYFARLDSCIDGVSVYRARFTGGRSLAKAYPAEADLVAGVPESGVTAAAGFAYESGIRLEQVFYKNSYIGRTFIKPTQEERESAVHMKLNVLKDVVKGKKLVLVDDSIVRGTTIANLIHMLRRAGALEVHVRICAPPFLYPCYYGTDVADTSQLVADHYTAEEICSRIGADSLGYMRIGDLDEMTCGLPICKACFDGKYPHKAVKSAD